VYHETYHPVSAATLDYTLKNKGWSEADKKKIIDGVSEANQQQKRRFRIDLSEHKFVEFDNGLLVNGSME
jgi:ribosomal protein L28